jgi:hypothetical protein
MVAGFKSEYVAGFVGIRNESHSLLAEAHTVLLGPALASVDVNAIEPRSVRIAPLQEV